MAKASLHFILSFSILRETGRKRVTKEDCVEVSTLKWLVERFRHLSCYNWDKQTFAWHDSERCTTLHVIFVFNTNERRCKNNNRDLFSFVFPDSEIIHRLLEVSLIFLYCKHFFLYIKLGNVFFTRSLKLNGWNVDKVNSIFYVAHFLSNYCAKKKKVETVFIGAYCIRLAIKVDPAKLCIYSVILYYSYYITFYTYIVYTLYNYVTL